VTESVANAASPTAEPLILGAPLFRAAGLRGATAVTVGADGRYYVRVARGEGTAGDSVLVLDALTGEATPAPTGAGVASWAATPTVDRHGRAYVVDSASGSVSVFDPHESGRATPRAVLSGIDAPAELAVDTVRGRLLVLERRAGRLQAFELP
jgi:hypothetical protein